MTTLTFIKHFQILEEKQTKGIYKANFKVFYGDKKIKYFLAEKNISFSQPRDISAVLLPILFINDEIQNFNENYFYNHWNEIKIENEIINFILPLEDIDDISKIKKMKNEMENFDVSNIVNKYNEKNYAFLLMSYDNKKMNVHIKTNFNANKKSKNIYYEIDNIKNKMEMNSVLKNLKFRLTDIWKEANVVNISMPLSIKIKFKNTEPSDSIQLNRIETNS